MFVRKYKKLRMRSQRIGSNFNLEQHNWMRIGKWSVIRHHREGAIPETLSRESIDKVPVADILLAKYI